MRKLLVPFFLIVAVTGAASQVQRAAPKVGDRAPDFSLPNPDGKAVTLKDYTSQGPVVVIFYRGYW